MTIGWINLNKPCGMTSRQAIDFVKRAAHRAKIGHAGTLDPLASGVLAVGVGPATRLIQYVHRFSKTYRAVFLLGRRSATEDVTSDVIELPSPHVPSLENIETAAASLTGRIQQRPPAFSAIKVEGQRAYRLARRGIELELTPREVEVQRLNVLNYAYPELTLDVECSSGTYVRSLGRDLAERLETAAVMASLVRTSVGPFDLAAAIAPEQLEHDSLADYLLSPTTVLPDWPRITLSSAQAALVANGGYVRFPQGSNDSEWLGVDSAGAPVAILVRRTPNLAGPTCLLLQLPPPTDRV